MYYSRFNKLPETYNIPDKYTYTTSENTFILSPEGKYKVYPNNIKLLISKTVDSFEYNNLCIDKVYEKEVSVKHISYIHKPIKLQHITIKETKKSTVSCIIELKDNKIIDVYYTSVDNPNDLNVLNSIISLSTIFI